MSSDLPAPKPKSLYLPKQVLQGYGCKNCVWKTYGQCPHNLSSDDSLAEGYCDELAQFLFSLAEKSDNVSAMKEKFMLYTQEMQAMADHMEFSKLQERYKQAKESGTHSPSELSEMAMGIEAYKIWWHRLTESVIKGLGRIADRESRSNDVDKTATKVTVQQLNVLLKQSDDILKVIEDKSGEDNGSKEEI